MRRHPLIAFFLITYVVGWMLLPFGTFLPIAPLVAALIVVPVTRGRAGLRELGARMIRWRVPWYCYLAAIGLPLAVIFGTAGLNVALGGTGWSPAAFAWADLAIMFALRWINPMDGALGEEPGFRGVALPGLLAGRSPLVAAAVLGVLVAGWHVPLAISTDGNPIGWVGIPTTFVITIVYCWLFLRSRGSVLITMLFHVIQGTVVIGTFGYTGGADLDRMLWLGFSAWTLVAVAVVVLDRPVWRRPPPEAPARPAGSVLTTPVVQP